MRRKAYGKITLHLHVKGRSHGNLQFHNVTVPIDLFDMVYLEKSETMKIMTDKSYLPNDKRNTVFQAIRLMKEKYNIKENFSVRIVKNIPAQSGLGGGSADAAAVIRMIDEMYTLNLNEHELIELASQIDEDTAFCLFNKPAEVGGIGNELRFITTNLNLYYLLIKPPYGISTKRFMKSFDDFKEKDERLSQLIAGLKKNDYKQVVENTHNDFQKSVMKKNRYIKKISRDMEKLGLEGVTMTGSGSSVFGLSEDLKTVQSAYEALVLKYPFIKYGKIL